MLILLALCLSTSTTNNSSSLSKQYSPFFLDALLNNLQSHNASMKRAKVEKKQKKGVADTEKERETENRRASDNVSRLLVWKMTLG